MSLLGYQNHIDAAKGPPPLTKDEQELKSMMENEVSIVRVSNPLPKLHDLNLKSLFLCIGHVRLLDC